MPRLVSLTLAFALQLRKKHGKTSVRVVKESCYPLPKHPHNYNTHHTHTNNITKSPTYPNSTNPTHTHTHTLQIYTKPPQYNFKQLQYTINQTVINKVYSQYHVTLMSTALLSQGLHLNHFISLHFRLKTLHINLVCSSLITKLHITSLILLILSDIM